MVNQRGRNEVSRETGRERNGRTVHRGRRERRAWRNTPLHVSHLPARVQTTPARVTPAAAQFVASFACVAPPVSITANPFVSFVFFVAHPSVSSVANPFVAYRAVAAHRRGCAC